MGFSSRSAMVADARRGVLLPFVQAKLGVSAPDDRFELEADHVAREVVRIPSGRAPWPTAGAVSVQRLCEECARGSSLCEEGAEEENAVQAKVKPGQAVPAIPDLTTRLQAIRSAGQPLPAPERSYFETRFGRDFSSVRIHTDPSAAEVAAQLGAHAFTVKRDIVFGAGEYCDDGGIHARQLLAHELTHVIQQGGANVRVLGDHGAIAPSDITLGEHPRSVEPRFGYDFSRGRIHPDAEAAAIASALNARAFTLGPNVVFGVHERIPEGDLGRHLLAHELTHAIHQRCASPLAKARPAPILAETPTPSQSPNGVAALSPPGLIQRKQDEDLVTGKYEWRKRLLQPGREGGETRVFFDLAKSDLDDEQKEQVLKPLVQAHASDKLVLNGFASEEGSAESNRDLISRRLQEVNRALRALSHQGKRELVSKLEESSGQIDYRYWRAVEVVVGAPGPKSANKTDECSRLYPSFDSEYPKRIQEAIADVTNARALLSAADDNVKSLFSRVFFTSDPGEIGLVSENLGKLQEQLSLFSDIESNRIRCGTRNDPLCNRAAGAYVTGRGMGGDSTLTLCPPDPYDIQVIIHESAHAAKDFGTADHAYRHESLIFHLTTEQAMTNTDSYVVLIELLNVADRSKVEFGSPNPVRSLPGVTREERAQLEKAVAWVQGGITTMYAQSAALYGVLHDSITAGAWTNPEYQRLMAAFAQLFGLTKPPSLPKESDKWSVAAIYDRLQKMSGTASAPLTGSKTSGDSADPANIPFWSEGPGFSFTVNPDFVNKDLDEQVRSLLSLLVKATPGIGSERVPSYVEAVAASRKFLGLAWPWVPA